MDAARTSLVFSLYVLKASERLSKSLVGDLVLEPFETTECAVGAYTESGSLLIDCWWSLVASKLFGFLFRCNAMISAISLASTRALFFPLTCRESSLKD